MTFKRAYACGVVWTGAKSTTEVGVTPEQGALDTVVERGMNDGENRVFPIQVSRQELLLFLGAVIFIGTYKNIFYISAQTLNRVNNLRFQAQLSPDANWRFPYPKRWKLRGSKLPHPGP